MNHMGTGVPVYLVYLATVLKYLCAEILELAGNAACDNKNKKSRIVPRRIIMVVKNYEELKKLLGGVTMNYKSLTML